MAINPPRILTLTVSKFPGTVRLVAQPAFYPSSNADSHDVQWATNSAFTTGVGATTGHPVNAATTFERAGYSVGTRYWFRVRSRGREGISGWSAASVVDIPPPPRAPAADVTNYKPPRTVRFSANIPYQDWFGASDRRIHYEYARNSAFTVGLGRVTQEESFGSVDFVLAPGYLYYFRARGQSSQGYGPYSGTVTQLVGSGPRVNQRGAWKYTSAYIKVNGKWRLAIAYVKQNGVWRPGSG